jgi:predicted unusual protein kinase regulating ubiquinone biosynthesis (AarF/ABC1/UbiB family)
MSTMLDDCPRTPLESVRRTVLEELGGLPEDVFDGFQGEPIASASLAQVLVS